MTSSSHRSFWAFAFDHLTLTARSIALAWVFWHKSACTLMNLCILIPILPNCCPYPWQFLELSPFIICIFWSSVNACYAPCRSDTDGCRPTRLSSNSVGPPSATLGTPRTALHNLSRDTGNLLTSLSFLLYLLIFPMPHSDYLLRVFLMSRLYTSVVLPVVV